MVNLSINVSENHMSALLGLLDRINGALEKLSAPKVVSKELPPAMSARDVAQLLGICVAKVLELSKAGILPHRKNGKNFVYSSKLVLEWLESNEDYLSTVRRPRKSKKEVSHETPSN